ncbi:MAG: bifunctional 5,10-methylenetetrahydrofolate dehydrogenase/5,10-methenyltetrahydrofolate cyclohydrolase [Candidatus Dojkabacteria bacterium]|jgi:methylenetetrahydrofolate dehydrogenase (NADP+)/methenyltetrahydrofolate cyclohydrolase
MEILDGRDISREILNKISFDIVKLKKEGKRIPRLDVILVGDDYGSIKYVGMKEKVGKEVGMLVQIHHLDEKVNTLDIVNLIDSLNKDENVDGLMVQLPLPSHIDKHLVLESIKPSKDVDGLTPTNLGKLFQKDPSAIAPATPLGIVKLLEAYNIKIFGKRVVILGSSTIVGKPLAAVMLEKNATVTLCNSHTVNIEDVSRTADILVSAIGKPELVKAEFLKKDCVLVDVGSNKHPETGKLVGDVDWSSVQGIPSYITPVPGGVGPMTIVCLMLNLMRCYRSDTR